MRSSNLFIAAAVLVTIGACAGGQPLPTLIFTPSVLYAGSAPALHISVLQGQTTGLGVRWNGADRSATSGSNPAFAGGYDVQLTAQDVATPGMAEVTMIDLKSGATVASGFVYIGYNVVPNDVVYDAARSRFYLTTTSTSKDAAFPANSLIAIDPASFKIGPILAIGNNPTSLALSDDGVTLHVMVDGDGVVRRVNLDTFTVSSQFQVRPATNSISGFARSAIAVMPGNPQTVAVYRHPDTGSSLTSIAIFDNGQKRPNDFGSFDGYDSLLFAPDGKSVFLGSYSRFNSPEGVLRYSVDSSGIPKQTPGSVSGGGPVTIQNGLLYTSSGTIIDIQTMQVIGLLGEGGGVAVDLANQRIIAAYLVATANNENYPEYLQAYDLATEDPLGWQPLDSWFYAAASANPGERLLRFGTDGLLFTGSVALLLFHTPLAGPAPVTSAAAMVNAASQQGGSIAPGEIVSIYGTNLGPAAPTSARLNSAGVYDSVLSHVEVWFDGKPGTALLAFGSQLNVIAPFEMQPGSNVDVQVWYFGIPSARIPLQVAVAAPGLFTRGGSGGGPVAVVNQDGSVNSPSPPGSVIALFGTGMGSTPGAVDGALARSAQNLNGNVQVTIGGRNVPVAYAGPAPGLPNGMFQLNLQLPPDLASGTLPILVTVNGQTSPKGATLEIR